MIRRNRIRMAMDIATALYPSTDFFKGDTPLMPSGRAAQFEVGIFNFGEIDTLADITSMKLEVKALTANSVIDVAAGALMSKTVSAAAFNVNLSKEVWSQGFDYHAVFEFSEAETGLAVGSLNYTDYGLVVTAQTSNGPITLGTATLRVVKDGGLTVVTPPPVADPSYVRVDDYEADKKGVAKRINEPNFSMIFYNELGYGVEIRATPGSVEPELEIIKHSPPA